MAPSSVPTLGGHAFRARWKRSSSGWQARTPGRWYDRIVGALSNLGVISAQTVGNVLKRHGIAPAPKLILFGEDALERALDEFIQHFHSERNHQGKGKVLLFPAAVTATSSGRISCRERLGGLLRHYSRAV